MSILKTKNNYISKKGYAILKNELSVTEQMNIRKDLTVKPFTPKNSLQVSKEFPIYRESGQKFYVPRRWGEDNFGKITDLKKNQISEGQDINIEFKGSLRDYQKNIVNTYMNHIKKENNFGGLLEIPCGRGKCFGRGTLIMLYNGGARPIEEIKVGDLLMGDDLKPRRVLSLANGRERMWIVKQECGVNYRVNQSHILCCIYMGYKPFPLQNRIIQHKDKIDISVDEYLDLDEDIQELLYGYKHEIIPLSASMSWMRTFTLHPYKIHLEVCHSNDDEYFGVMIDGTNRRFLLADNTVVHNTVIALNIIAELKKKAIVIVHKEFLMNQWIERIEQFLPNAKIGKIQGNTIDIEGKDIVIGMLQSLSMKEYPSEIFEDFGLMIVDETHHIAAEVFSRALFKIVTRHTLGLSATMNRKDGLTKVFKMFLGDVVYKEKREKDQEVLIKSIFYNHTDEEFNNMVYNYKGSPHFSVMVKKLCEFKPRLEFIFNLIKDELELCENQQIMVLAHNKTLLTYLYKRLKTENVADGDIGYYLGGMKEQDLKKSESCKIVIATYAMAEEALDIKTLSKIIFCTPKTDVTQAVGRILRQIHQNTQPTVIDIVDRHENFTRQWYKRKAFYMKNDYKIVQIDSRVYATKNWEPLYDPKNKIEHKSKEAIHGIKLNGKFMIKKK